MAHSSPTTTPQLNNLAPVTGRMINEENEIHNIVDNYGSLRVADVSSTAVHDGVAWVYTTSGSVLSGQTMYLLGRVGSIVAHLWEFYIRSDSAPMLIEFFEAPTVTAPGTIQTKINRNRQIESIGEMLIYAGPTISVDGIKLFEGKILGSNQTVSGDDFKGEWLLKTNTDYIFKITNQSNQTANMSAGFNWVEID